MIFFLSKLFSNYCFNRALTSIVTALMIAIIFTSILFLPPQSLAAETIEKKAPSELSQFEQVNSLNNDTTVTQTEGETLPEEELSDIDKIIKIETPSELVAPTLPESVEVETVNIQPELTPEQNFLAAIEQQLIDISDRYFDELFLSVEADILHNLLLVKVKDDWYNLDRGNQNKWVNNLFSRSQEFNFKKLEIKDTSNTLIARSPVVGNEMVIFQREKE